MGQPNPLDYDVPTRRVGRPLTVVALSTGIVANISIVCAYLLFHDVISFTRRSSTDSLVTRLLFVSICMAIVSSFTAPIAWLRSRLLLAGGSVAIAACYWVIFVVIVITGAL